MLPTILLLSLPRFAGIPVPCIPVSGAPTTQRLRRIGGSWGHPALADLMAQTIDTAVPWSR